MQDDPKAPRWVENPGRGSVSGADLVLAQALGCMSACRPAAREYGKDSPAAGGIDLAMSAVHRVSSDGSRHSGAFNELSGKE